MNKGSLGLLIKLDTDALVPKGRQEMGIRMKSSKN